MSRVRAGISYHPDSVTAQDLQKPYYLYPDQRTVASLLRRTWLRGVGTNAWIAACVTLPAARFLLGQPMPSTDQSSGALPHVRSLSDGGVLGLPLLTLSHGAKAVTRAAAMRARSSSYVISKSFDALNEALSLHAWVYGLGRDCVVEAARLGTLVVTLPHSVVYALIHELVSCCCVKTPTCYFSQLDAGAQTLILNRLEADSAQSLACVNRGLRSLVDSESSRRIWATALKNYAPSHLHDDGTQPLAELRQRANLYRNAARRVGYVAGLLSESYTLSNRVNGGALQWVTDDDSMPRVRSLWCPAASETMQAMQQGLHDMLTFTPDGLRLRQADGGGWIKSLQELHLPPLCGDVHIWRSPCGRWAVIDCGERLSAGPRWLLDLKSATVMQQLPPTGEMAFGWERAPRWARDGSVMALQVGSAAETVCFFACPAGSTPAFTSRAQGLARAVINPAGTHLVATTDGGGTKIYEILEPGSYEELMGMPQDLTTTSAKFAAWSPCGLYVALAVEERLMLLDSRTGRRLTRLPLEGEVTDVAWLQTERVVKLAVQQSTAQASLTHVYTLAEIKAPSYAKP